MLKVAAGDELDWDYLSNIQPKGAAIEVRVYAEDPVKKRKERQPITIAISNGGCSWYVIVCAFYCHLL